MMTRLLFARSLGTASLLAALLGCSTEAPSTDNAAGRDTSSPASTPTATFFDEAGTPVTSSFYLDAVTLHVSGLVPGSTVRIDAEMAPWSSHASFLVGPDGVIDTGRDAPSEGTYQGVDPDGFFWSMDSATFEYAKSPDVTFRIDALSETPLSTTLERPFEVAGTTSRVVGKAGIVGELLVPPGDGKKPVLLAFGGSEGGASGGLTYASELVPRGYAVLALAYFGEKGLPTSLEDIPLEYFDDALAWLSEQPEIDATRMGVIGGSRGGELALLLGARHPELKAVVADAPSAYVWGAAGSADGHAWTAAGVPLPEVPSAGSSGKLVTTSTGETARSFTPSFEDNLAKASPTELEAARIPVESSGAAIAMFSGADDLLWPSCTFAEVAMQKLQGSGHAALHPDESTCFSDAGHIVNVVGLPTTHTAAVPMPSGAGKMALGGTAAGTAHAGRERQRRLLAFLARTLR